MIINILNSLKINYIKVIFKMIFTQIFLQLNNYSINKKLCFLYSRLNFEFVYQNVHLRVN